MSGSSGQQHQQLGLDGIRVLELVHQDELEALAGTPPRTGGRIAHQVARPDQQVEKIKRAGRELAILVAAHAVAAVPHGPVPRGRRSRRRGTPAMRLRARRARRELPDASEPAANTAPTALALAPEVAIGGQRDEKRLQPVVVARRLLRRAARSIAGLPPERRRVSWNDEVALLDRIGGPRRNIHDRSTTRRSMAGRSHAGRFQGAGGPATAAAHAGALQPLNRAVCLVCIAPPARIAAGAVSDARPRRGSAAALHPRRECLVEEPVTLGFGEHIEGRIDPRLDGPLTEQLGAEPVNRADVCLFELEDGVVEAAACSLRRRAGRPRRAPAPHAAAA